MLPDQDGVELQQLDAAVAAQLLAIDACGLGGAVLHTADYEAAAEFLSNLAGLLPDATPMLRVPRQVSDDHLLGGLDLVATKIQGRAVAEPGLLSRADGGFIVLPGAERMGAAAAARIAAAMDDKAVRLERNGLAKAAAARFGAIAIDESADGESAVPYSLGDRLAFKLTLATRRHAPQVETNSSPADADIETARRLLGTVAIGPDAPEVFATMAVSLGIASLRAPILALRAARAHAALCGRNLVDTDDIAVAARLVFAPRATRLPQNEDGPSQADAPSEPPDPTADPNQSDGAQEPGTQPDSSDMTQASPPEPPSSKPPDDTKDIAIAAVKAALPDGLLQHNAAAEQRSPKPAGAGAGKQRNCANRGRPIGHRPGKPQSGARLDVLATIRAAAPWQAFRRKQRIEADAAREPLIDIRPSDFRIARYQQGTEAVIVFVVDASGSSALNRLAEAKGAIELLLADCYVRRDQVAMIAYQRRSAELLLAPTRSLTRAKRVLADLAGGGATPLGAGLELAATQASSIRSRGQSPVCMILTDGQANVSRSGATGREAAQADALVAAAALRQTGAQLILVDTAVRPRPFCRDLAGKLGARYVALPNAEASSLSRVARQAQSEGGRNVR